MYLCSTKTSRVTAGRHALAIAAWKNKEAPTRSYLVVSSLHAWREVSAALHVSHVSLLVFWEGAVKNTLLGAVLWV